MLKLGYRYEQYLSRVLWVVEKIEQGEKRRKRVGMQMSDSFSFSEKSKKTGEERHCEDSGKRRILVLTGWKLMCKLKEVKGVSLK